ncbi:hypothetical protein IQE94_09910 [Synechocystis sp. PCC 7339]|uniref:hypothetical protein n=1 Tax=unclassified Synechocystis TaxID=2640012 RepID=UPI001BAEB515|nr:MULTISPECIES: hypothetical protein [unclassified Synechocystis]QUS59299.1 hypothetical protein HTZ78_00400 [Synechocystis sp. PCC 7338]UAJ71486.1 hypothetical protein IQE94_09910 [Synechocystis sp. PCC 7339]
MNLDTIQQDLAELSPEAQEIVFDLIESLKENHVANTSVYSTDWSDFIGCIDAEPDLSRKYKTYLNCELEKKHDHC